MTPRRRPATEKDVVAAVLLGELDGSFETIAKAYVERIGKAGGTVAWKLYWKPEDLTVTEEDMTPGDYRSIEKLCGVGWRQVDPQADMSQLVTILALHLGRRDGIKTSEAVDRIEAHPVVGNLTVSVYEAAVPLEATRT